ncbi:MAG: four helix bundle protein [Ignavibacteriae bacterium]|nr:four helix bundle protein [Ignavibacteriota bacterium]
MKTSGYSFKDLEVYKVAREYRKKIYQLIKKLPTEEKHNLQSQMRRAALSVTNNIAEGHGRFHYLETLQFLRQSRGSLEELIDDLNACHDEKYIGEAEIEKLKDESYELLKKLNSYGAYLRKRKNESSQERY